MFWHKTDYDFPTPQLPPPPKGELLKQRAGELLIFKYFLKGKFPAKNHCIIKANSWF